MKMDEIAEICGIHAGDGYMRYGKRTELDISGSIEEKVYYDTHVVPLFSKAFDIKINGRLFPHRNTYGFVIRDKGIIKKMNAFGFPYGKKTMKLRVPKFIIDSKNKKIKCKFLRGLFDTDGCITFDKRYSKKYIPFKRDYHTYPRVIIVTISNKFFLDLQKLLNDLGISFWPQIHKSKKHTNFNTSFRIWVRGKNVEKWIDIIGSKNPIKLSRYKIWKKHGFCPANTSYEDRLRVLNNEIDPKKLYGPVA